MGFFLGWGCLGHGDVVGYHMDGELNHRKCDFLAHMFNLVYDLKFLGAPIFISKNRHKSTFAALV